VLHSQQPNALTGICPIVNEAHVGLYPPLSGKLCVTSILLLKKLPIVHASHILLSLWLIYSQIVYQVTFFQLSIDMDRSSTADFTPLVELTAMILRVGSAAMQSIPKDGGRLPSTHSYLLESYKCDSTASDMVKFLFHNPNIARSKE